MVKTERIGLIVTTEEKGWVVQLAKIEGGLSQAALIRRLIYQAAEAHCLISNRSISNPPESQEISSYHETAK